MENTILGAEVNSITDEELKEMKKQAFEEFLEDFNTYNYND